MMIHWGIMGCGNIARIFANDFQATQPGKLLAAASRNQQKADEFCHTHGIERAYGSYEALANDPDVDAIYVASPHSHHLEHTLLALQNNKAVLCEKPLAPNEHQVQRMQETARKHQTFLMEALWTYFLPPVIQAQQWIREGLIGQVQLIQADFGFYMELDEESRVFNPQLAGGALLDVGIYPIAFAQFIAGGYPEAIQAMSQQAPTGVDAQTIIQLQYGSGVQAQLNCAVSTHTRQHAYIYGTQGYIYLPYFWRASEAYLFTSHSEQVYKDTRPTRGYHYEVVEVNRCLEQQQVSSAVVSWEKSRAFARIMDEVRRQTGIKYPFE